MPGIRSPEIRVQIETQPRKLNGSLDRRFEVMPPPNDVPRGIDIPLNPRLPQ